MSTSALGATRARIVTAFLRDGNRVLLCHRSPQRRRYPDVWDLPGGHVEPGELPGAALARELHEELGIDVERQGLFTGTRGRQIAGRFSLIGTTAFPYADEWKGLVASLETALRLRGHHSGSLADLDRYLHDRTGGMIGSLSHLIRGAAIEAILTGGETITKTVLERVELDHAADSQHAAGRKRRR